MENSNLTPVQNAVYKAVKALSEKANFTEAIVAKKIRENEKIEGNKKAVIALNDLEKAISCLEEENIFFAIRVNSANDLILSKVDSPQALAQEARHRRLQSEKSMTIFKTSDFTKKDKSKPKNKVRTERKSLRTNIDFDQLDY